MKKVLFGIALIAFLAPVAASARSMGGLLRPFPTSPVLPLNPPPSLPSPIIKPTPAMPEIALPPHIANDPARLQRYLKRFGR